MKRFPAKVLLFGEYSVLIGSSALGMPFPQFGGALILPDPGDAAAEETESNVKLSELVAAFREKGPAIREFLDIDRMGEDIRRGLIFRSDIPRQYGMGSSGALCAALYDAYARPVTRVEPDLVCLRQRLGMMESVFHGTSSGFDPLISISGSALRLKADGAIERTDLSWLVSSRSGLTLMLLDSGLPCSTRPLVSTFLEAFSDNGPRSSEGNIYRCLVNESVDFILAMDVEGLFERVRMIGAFQLSSMPELIPPGLAGLWRQGMESGLFSLKLCGSGGGGYTFCFTRRPVETGKVLDRAGIRRLLISSS